MTKDLIFCLKYYIIPILVRNGQTKTKEKEMKKILVSVLLAICCVCLAVGLVGCGNAELFEFSEYDGGFQLVSVKGEEEVYEIPSEREGKKVIRIGNGVFADNSRVKKIVIPETVKEIGERAFYGCTALTEVVYGEKILPLYSVNDKYSGNVGNLVVGNEAFVGVSCAKKITTGEADGTKVKFTLGDSVKKMSYIPAMNDNVKPETAKEEIFVVQSETTVDFHAYGKFRSVEIILTDKNDSQIFFPKIEVGVSADEYNIAYLCASYPVFTYCAGMPYFTNDYKIPTIIALNRYYQLDFDKLPENVYAVPTLKKSQNSIDMGIFFNDIAQYVKELYELNPDVKFNAYLNDLHIQYYLRTFVANRIPEENYNVIFLSDGTGSAGMLNNLFETDNPREKYGKMLNEWNQVKEYVWNNGYDATAIAEICKTEVAGYDWPQFYYYVMINENSAKNGKGSANVRWILSRIRTNENLKPVFAKDKDFANEIKNNSEELGVGTLFGQLTEEQKTSLKEMYKFNDGIFEKAKELDKKVMVIIDGRWEPDNAEKIEKFKNYFSATMDYYGDEYVYYYKGHPATALEGLDQKQAMYEEMRSRGYDVEEADAGINAELFIFFMPEVNMCGYGSTTYDSANGNICKTLWGSKEEYKNAVYYSYFDTFMTVIARGTSNYNGITLDVEKNYVLIEYADATDEQKIEYAKHSFAIMSVGESKVRHFKTVEGTIMEVDAEGNAIV